jgi:peptide/nickel transport system substrate-binding protein
VKVRLPATVAATAAMVASFVTPSVAAASTVQPGMSNGVIPLLRIGETGTVSSLDPALLYNVIETSTPMEGLVALGANSELVPQLATSVSRPSPTVYVFHLRHGVKFWDGNQMTSADVVTSLEHYEQPAYSTASSYLDVASIRADGPYVVVITLKTPDAGFESTLAWQGDIFEKKFYEAHKTTMGHPGTLIEGTGPWQVTSFDPTTSEELTANRAYPSTASC